MTFGENFTISDEETLKVCYNCGKEIITNSKIPLCDICYSFYIEPIY